MERRRTVRLLTMKALVALGREDGTLLGAGWPLLDISEGGLRFAIPRDHPNPPEVDEKIIVTVEFVGVDETGQAEVAAAEEGEAAKNVPPGDRLSMPASVRRVADSGEDDVCEVSLEFTDLKPRDRERLRGTVLDIAMEKIAKHKEGLVGSIAAAEERPGSRRLGKILVDRSVMTERDLERFLKEDYANGTPIGRQLVKLGLAQEGDVARALAEQAELEYADLEMEGIDLLRIRQFTEGYLMQHLFVPLSMETKSVTVASANPLPEEVLTEIEKQYKRAVKNVLSSERQIMSAVQKAFHISRNQRRSARFPAGLSLRYKFYDQEWQPVHPDVLFGLTKNLSETGALFLGPLPPGMDSLPDASETHIGVHLFLPNQPQPIRAPCRLVRVTVVRSADPRSDTRPLCLFAVRVLGVSDDDRRRLNLFRMQSFLPRQEHDRNT